MSIISAGGAVVGSAAGGYQISRSLRSNGTYAGGSDYMQRQNSGTSGNRKVWTLSLWMKICNITSNDEHIWMVSNTGVGGNPSAYVRLLLENNVLKLGSNSSASEAFASAALLRDVSAWYHVVISCDNANTILRVYVNGVEWTTANGFLASKTNPTNTDGVVNNANYYNHFCMFRTAEPRTFNGYLAEIHFVDGSALPATTFGEFNSETGVWQPIQVTVVTYGTQGYYLPLNDNASTTTLGYDGAGSNNFTLSGFSVTAGAGNDSLVDTPTNYGTDTGVGGEVRGNYATLNPLWKGSGAVLTNGNLDNTPTTAVSAALSTIPVSGGKFYAEISHTVSNASAVGMFFTAANLSAPSFTIGVTSQTGLWEWYDNGSGVYATSDGGAFGSSLRSTAFRTAGTFQFALDADNGKFWFGKNNVWYDSSGGTTGDPATGANPTFTISTTRGPFNFGVGQNGGYVTMSFNAGQRPFAYTAPSGFKALCTQNLPEPTIKDGGDYFNAVLYTGNGSTQSITGVGFQPDFLWGKSRSVGYFHNLTDTNRGLTKYLFSDLTNAEATYSDKVTAVTSDGFTLGADTSTDGSVNVNGSSQVMWCWKANGAGSTNTAGTITSTVSVNTTSGFSIVTYTGTGANATVGHGLGVAPSMIIVKGRFASNWSVYHASITNATTSILILNSTSAAVGSLPTYWNSTAPTSTVFSLGSDSNVNSTNSAGLVAYCFAPVAGYSAFGSYTGNGSADGPFVYTGFRPRFIIVKPSSATGSWILHDTARNPYNVSNLELQPNTSIAEYSTSAVGAGDRFDILSNGFKNRSSNVGANASGTTYIYMAFAENPFKYSLAR